MTDREHPCGSCYWWDSVGLEADPSVHLCHEPYNLELGLATPSNGGANCAYFRRANSDDPATTWNRKRCGRNTDGRGKAKDPAAVKRGKNSKRKGKKGEKEWGEYVVERIGGEFIARGGDRDVQFIGNALAPVQHEVKRRKAFSMLAHCRQARTDGLRHGLQRSLVAFRADCKPGERKQWHVVLDADDYLTDMMELEGRRACDAEDERRAIARETGALD